MTTDEKSFRQAIKNRAASRQAQAQLKVNYHRNIPDGSNIAVWFSCGAASAVAAKKTLELYGDTCKVRILNNPVIEEHPDNQRFLKDVQEWLGVEIEFVLNPKYPNCSAKEVWNTEKFMGGMFGAPCTRQLKARARQHYEQNNDCDYHVLGFTAEEHGRAKRFVLLTDDRLLPVLVNQGITKSECFIILQNAGIKLPAIYGYGFPNANCIGCVKATSPTYWNLVRQHFPEVFKDRAEQSRKFGKHLTIIKGEKIFLDELDPDAKGKDLKNMQTECGLFCEET